MQRIAVIDYGMGNLRSVSKAIEHVVTDTEVVVTSDPVVIDAADRVVCPGQGAAADIMQAMSAAGLVDVVRRSVVERPFLGICMGLQVLFSYSEENYGVQCLDVLPGEVHRFADSMQDGKRKLKVPHMGWSPVTQTLSHPMWDGIDDGTRFYFAHSYFCAPADVSIVAGRCRYGIDFTVAVARGTLFACQFHPEKSADAGLRLLGNFARWRPT